MLAVSSVLTHLPDLEGHEEKLLCEETLCEDNEVSYSQIGNCYWGVGREKNKYFTPSVWVAIFCTDIEQHHVCPERESVQMTNTVWQTSLILRKDCLCFESFFN